MRLPVALLSVVAVPASVLAAPVVSLPAAAPQPVAPRVQELDLPIGVVEAAEARGGAVAGAVLVATPERGTEPFTTLGVTWSPDADTGEVAVAVRTRSSGRWSDWTPLEAEEPEVLEGAPDARGTAVRGGTEPLYAGPSDGVQVRLELLSGTAPTDVRLALVDPGSSPADQPAALPAGGTAHAAATAPVIRSRAQWGADESIKRAAPSYASTISAVTVHHTASSNDYSAAEVPGLIRGFYAYHVKSLGWADIGYNVLVDKFGTAWEGRAGGLDRPVIGAHAGGFNTGTAGVSMIGTYGTVEPPAATKETVAHVAAWKLGLHDRDPRSSVTLTSGGSTRYASGTAVTLPRIFGHRDVSSTACPGDRGQASLVGIRGRAAVLQSSTAGPAPIPTTATPTPVPTPSAPPPPAKPFGALDAVTGLGGAVRVAGWVIDPDATTHTTVAVRIGGASAVDVAADKQRPDLPTAYPQYGPEHGFEAMLPAPVGRQTVCLSALDQGGTQHLSLGCRDVEVGQADPRGALDRARATADVVGVRVSGWALDTDAPDGSRVVVSVDGVDVRTLTADAPRPDVALLYPGVSDRRGYDAIVPAAPGARRLCALAVNEGRGADVQLGCLAVDVPARPAPAAAPGSRPVDDACPDGAVPRSGFLDTATSVHRAAVDCAVWWELTGGLSAERFGPTQSLTRGQVASFLARLLTTAGSTLPASPPNAFDDDTGSPHEKAIDQMAAVGVVAGRGARRYEPAATVTRDQMASYLVRAYEQHVGAPLPEGGDWYADDDGSVHEASIGKAARAGFTGGTGPRRYTPRATTDRGQVASFLTRVVDLLVESGRAPRRG